MRRLVLASGNVGKLAEFADSLSSLGITLQPQSAFAVPEAAETGLSFVENALLKARNAARHSGLPALADDSGISVDALRGAPGIYSARYAGAGASDQANRAKLLTTLAGRPPAQRTARFICMLALVRHADDPLPLLAQGEWSGRIALAERGHNGFGYDALFELPTCGRTVAELAAAEKRRRSHRAQALARLRQQLAQRPQWLATATCAGSNPSPGVAGRHC